MKFRVGGAKKMHEPLRVAFKIWLTVLIYYTFSPPSPCHSCKKKGCVSETEIRVLDGTNLQMRLVYT